MRKMVPLLDRAGNTMAWTDPNSGWISDQKGNVFALVWFAGVFDRTGAQIGWWLRRPHTGSVRSRSTIFAPNENRRSCHAAPRKDTTAAQAAFALASSSAEMVSNAVLEKTPMGGS